jgi:hypothetical protein
MVVFDKSAGREVSADKPDALRLADPSIIEYGSTEEIGEVVKPNAANYDINEKRHSPSSAPGGGPVQEVDEIQDETPPWPSSTQCGRRRGHRKFTSTSSSATDGFQSL